MACTHVSVVAVVMYRKEGHECLRGRAIIESNQMKTSDADFDSNRPCLEMLQHVQALVLSQWMRTQRMELNA